MAITLTDAQIIREVVHSYDGSLTADQTTDTGALIDEAQTEAESFAEAVGLPDNDGRILAYARMRAVAKVRAYFRGIAAAMPDFKAADDLAEEIEEQAVKDWENHDTYDVHLVAATEQTKELCKKIARDPDDDVFVALTKIDTYARVMREIKPEIGVQLEQLVDLFRQRLLDDINFRKGSS